MTIGQIRASAQLRADNLAKKDEKALARAKAAQEKRQLAADMAVKAVIGKIDY